MKIIILHIIQFVTIILLIVVTGVFWGTWLALTRSLNAFSLAEFIHNGKVIIANLATPMSIIFPICILSILLTLKSSHKECSKQFYFTLAALVFILAALLITLLVEVPIDKKINTWTVATAPPGWKDIRNTWGTFHVLRTLAALAGTICFIFPIVFYKK